MVNQQPNPRLWGVGVFFAAAQLGGEGKRTQKVIPEETGKRFDGGPEGKRGLATIPDGDIFTAIQTCENIGESIPVILFGAVSGNASGLESLPDGINIGEFSEIIVEGCLKQFFAVSCGGEAVKILLSGDLQKPAIISAMTGPIPTLPGDERGRAGFQLLGFT